MAVGTQQGQRCRRANRHPDGTSAPVCAGLVCILGSGVDARGIGYRFLGCERGCWSVKETIPEPETMPLFGGDF